MPEMISWGLRLLTPSIVSRFGMRDVECRYRRFPRPPSGVAVLMGRCQHQIFPGGS